MKRQSCYLRARQKRAIRDRFRSRLRRRFMKRIAPERRFIAPSQRIAAPKCLDLMRGHGRLVVGFLRAVAEMVLEKNMPVRMDFSTTEEIHVPGAIVLFAEIDRIVSLASVAKPVTIISPIQRRPREVLKQIGLYDLTGDHCSTIPQREDVVYWRAIKGNTQTGDVYGPVVEAIAARANRDDAKKLEVSGLWRGVNESIINSVEHAYKKSRRDGFSGLNDTKWWMLSQIRDSVCTIAVCDLGCGYKSTINDSIPVKFIQSVAAFISALNIDVRAITTAMAYGRSGTHQGHRGKGSRDVLSLLQTHGEGSLVVMSNTGWVRYCYKDGMETERTDGDVKIDIGGTIVWWRLPLKG